MFKIGYPNHGQWKQNKKNKVRIFFYVLPILFIDIMFQFGNLNLNLYIFFIFTCHQKTIRKKSKIKNKTKSLSFYPPHHLLPHLASKKTRICKSFWMISPPFVHITEHHSNPTSSYPIPETSLWLKHLLARTKGLKLLNKWK